MESEDIERRFTYHSPSDTRKVWHEQARQGCRRLAQLINEGVPEGREKSLAITKLEEVMFWANAGIARAEVPYDQ